MASVIKIKRSGNAGGAPATLKSGELAYTYTDGVNKLYFGKGDNGSGDATEVVAIGGQSYINLLDHTPGVLTTSSTIITDSNNKINLLNVDNITLDGSTISTNLTNENLVLSPNGSGKISFYSQYTFPTTAGGTGQALVYDGAGGLTWAGVTTANTATNISGGTAGQVPYQTAAGITSFYGPGTTGQLLVSGGTSGPVYTNTSSIYVGNTVNAEKWLTPRTVTFTGDTTGTFTIDGSANVTNVNLTIQSDSVALGTDTTGDYVATGATSGLGISGSTTGENQTFTVTSNATSTNANSTLVFRDTLGNFSAGTVTASLSGNASSADKWSAPRTITLAGDLSGNISIDGSTNVILTATIAADSVALGTDTTGDYVATGATSGLGISGSTSGENQTFTVTSNATSTNANSTLVFRDGAGNFSAGTVTASLSGNATSADKWSASRTVTLAGDLSGTASFDGSTNFTLTATIAADSVALGTDTTGDYVAIGATSGFGLSGSTTGENQTFTVTSNATSTNANSTLVFRDASGSFAASTITATNLTVGDAGFGSVYLTQFASVFAEGGASTANVLLQASANNLAGGGIGIATLGGGQSLYSSGAINFTTNRTVRDRDTPTGGNTFMTLSTSGVLTLSGNVTASNTQTGALVVTGGVGIGGNLYVGGEIVAEKLTIQLTTITTTLVQTDDIIQTVNTTNATSTNTGALQVAGGAGIGKDLYVGGTIYGTVFGSITTASNLLGGTTGQVPYQSAPGVTSFYGPGTVGQLLVSGGAGAPIYTNTGSIYVSRAVDADKWSAARTITLAGDLSGTANFDGSSNFILTATIAADSIALGTDTTGDYVATGATSGFGISGSTSGENQTFTITSNATSTNANSTLVFRDNSGNFSANTITASLSGNATSADKWSAARTITLAGDLSGNISIDGSTNVTLTATIAADSVALGTDTTGDYVATGATSGFGISGSTTGENQTFTITSNATSTNASSTLVFRDSSGNFSASNITASLLGNATSADKWSALRTITLAGDLSGNISIDGSTNVTLTATIVADSVALGTDTTGDYVATGATSGFGISGSTTGENQTFTITSNATSTNASNTIVFRDGSGNFTANVVTADIVGTASSANDLTGGAAGSLPYQTSAGVTVFLPLGLDGKILQVSTATNTPIWGDIDGGTY